MRVIKSLLTRKEWIVFRLPEDWKYPDSFLGERLEWAWANENILDLFFSMDRARIRIFKKFLLRRFVGIISSCQGQWASYAWMKHPESIGPAHLPRNVKKLPVYWIFYCRTHELYQSKRIYKQSLCNLAEWARKRNSKADIYIDTELNNVSSRKAILAVGFKPCGVIRTLSIVFPKLGHITFGDWKRSSHHGELTTK